MQKVSPVKMLIYYLGYRSHYQITKLQSIMHLCVSRVLLL